MWPEPGEALSRTLEAEEVLTELYTKALNTWVVDVQTFVVPPSLTAATEPPPDPGAVTEQASGLDLLLDELILPGLSTLYCLALVEAMGGIGIPLPSLPNIFRGTDDDTLVPTSELPEIPVVNPEVLRTLTRLTRFKQTDITEAVDRVYADPYLRQQTEDFIETQRALVRATGPMVQAKVEAAVRDTAVRELDPVAAEPEPLIEVTITRQREAAAAVVTPGSSELVDVAQLQGYQAAGVQNAAVIAAAEFSPDVLDKVWIATLDGKTRDSHFAADGQRAPLGGNFAIGTSSLRYPGDPMGPANEVRNCRCRVGVLAPDEEIPDEVDRHTERLNGRDSVQVNRQGSQRDEIERRRDRGVVRARDDVNAVGVTAAGGWTAPSEQEYTMADGAELFRTFTDQPVAFIGIETSDGRMLSPDIELTVRNPPLPAMWCKQTGEGHMEAYTVGVGEAFRIDGNRVLATGYWLNTSESDEAFTAAGHKVSRPSVDLAATEWILTVDGREITEDEWFDLPADAKVVQTITKAELIGFTMVATPAFGDTMIEFDAARGSRDLALVASAADEFRPRIYPTDHFKRTPDQYLTEPTEIQMDPATGRIFGHLACFGSCHRSIQSQCVLAPRSPSDYSQFHTSPAVRLDDGTRVAVGRLTVGTGHAADTLGGAAAMAHYDNTGACFALVRAYETPVGIEISGVAAPWATAEQIEMGLSAPLSGDWRDFGQGLDLIAALAVNTPGFAVRGRTDDAGRPAALVASLGPARGKRRDDAQMTAEQIADVVARSVTSALDAREQAAAFDALVATAIDKVGPPPTPEPPKTAHDELGELIAARGL